MTAQFAEILDAFKREERPEVVLSIAGDSAATRLLVAWSNARVYFRRSRIPLRGRDHVIRWKWLWKHVCFSLKDLAGRAGIPVADARVKMAELIGNRVIYPDGSLNQFAQRFLRKTVLDLFDMNPAVRRRTKRCELATAMSRP